MITGQGLPFVCCPSLLSWHTVALAEQELCAMGKRRHMQAQLDAGKEKIPRRPKPVRQRMSFGGRDKKKSSADLGKSAKPMRHSLDNVGDHEVKVHTNWRCSIHC